MEPQHTTDRNLNAITRLTALWAFSESGLGGLMFALKIPLTGFFVGGFAVLLIGMIAWYAGRDYKQVLKATLLVLLVKATASPHSPPPAYLAVAFQGFTGALLYRSIRNFKIASVLLAVLAMAESALQKIIVMTLIYGKSIWLAIDKLFGSISKEFSLHIDVSFSLLLIGGYLLVYLVWGCLVGLFSAALPARIGLRKAEILEWYRQHPAGESGVALKRRKKFRIWIYIAVLLFILTVFLLGGDNKQQVLFILVRSLAAVLLLFFVLRPLINSLLQRWIQKQGSRHKQEAAVILALLPGIRRYVGPCWQLAARQPSRFRQLRYFIYYMIALTLYEEQNERADLPVQPGYQNR